MTPITHDKCSTYSIGKIPISVVLFSFFWVLNFRHFSIQKLLGRFWKDLFFFLAKNSTIFSIFWKKKFARNFISKKWGKKKTDNKYIVVIVRICEAQVDPSAIRLEIFSIIDTPHNPRM
jgi:hypothetical protein